MSSMNLKKRSPSMTRIQRYTNVLTSFQLIQKSKSSPTITTQISNIFAKNGTFYIVQRTKIAASINIYHVHGLLPYGKYNEARYTQSLVFNESDYYDLYNSPYSWNIAKQLHDFKFNVCFFLGISLTDPDMKRLLELGRNQLKFNFIFARKEKGYDESVFEAIASYFFSFDLIVVWVEEYSEIGKWLELL